METSEGKNVKKTYDSPIHILEQVNTRCRRYSDDEWEIAEKLMLTMSNGEVSKRVPMHKDTIRVRRKKAGIREFGIGRPGRYKRLKPAPPIDVTALLRKMYCPAVAEQLQGKDNRLL